MAEEWNYNNDAEPETWVETEKDEADWSDSDVATPSSWQ